MCQARKGKGWLDCQPDLSGTTGHEKAAEIKNKKKVSLAFSQSLLCFNHTASSLSNTDPQCFLPARPHCAFSQYRPGSWLILHMLCLCICLFLCSNIKVVKMNEQTVIISSRQQEAVKSYNSIAISGKTTPQ